MFFVFQLRINPNTGKLALAKQQNIDVILSC